MNEEVPAPKKKELKTFSFTRTMQPNEETPQGPKENKAQKENIVLNITLTLYEDEIVFNAKQSKENIKVPHIIYEKGYTFENLKNYKILSILTLDKIFDIIKNSFTDNLDKISFLDNELKVILMVNLMNVMTEEINIDIPMIKMNSQEEMIVLKESMKYLDNERNELRNEMKTISATLEELLKKIKEKEIQHENSMLELKKVIENNKIEFQKKLEEKDNEMKKKMEEKDSEMMVKFEKIEEKNNEFQKALDDNKIEIQKTLDDNKMEIIDLRKTEQYVKSKLICEEKEEEEKDNHIYKRELNISETKNIFNLEITMILFQEKIKFIIKEIQDELNNNPTIYEANFNYESLSQKTVHFKNLGNLDSIFNFLHDLFNDRADAIKKENNKIIINVTFKLGNKDEEISFELSEKNIGLEITLKNFSQTLKEINKNNIETNNDLKNTKNNLEKTKADFKKELLEKVYPIGSYYWSSSNISPSNIFGGSWTKINGRFLFASDNSHYVGETGGQERVTLTINEIPSHSHGYDKFKRYGGWYLKLEDVSEQKFPSIGSNDEWTYSETTSSTGGGASHNNMPPYLTANCWKRIG